MSDKTQWTTRELAEEAARRGRPVSREHIRRQCVSGALRATFIGRRWLISDWVAQRWLEKWLEEG